MVPGPRHAALGSEVKGSHSAFRYLSARRAAVVCHAHHDSHGQCMATGGATHRPTCHSGPATGLGLAKRSVILSPDHVSGFPNAFLLSEGHS